MKKKRVLKVIVILILLVIAAIGKAVYDDIKSEHRADAILDDIVANKVEIKDIDYNSLGKYGAFVKEFGEFYVKLDSDTNTMKSEFDKYDNYNVLDLKYIKNPEEGKKQIGQFADEFSKACTILNDDIASFDNAIEKAPLSSTEKEKIKKDFEAEESKTVDEFKSLSENVQSMKTKGQALYDFLTSIKGKYEVTNDKLIFDSQVDLDKYNELEKAVLADAGNTKNTK